MDLKLEEYRKKRRREAYYVSVKDKLFSYINMNNCVEDPSDISNQVEKDKLITEKSNYEDDSISCCSSEVPFNEEGLNEEVCSPSWYTIVLYSLYFLLWSTVMSIAVLLEFGSVFFIISLFVFIGFNTRTSPRKSGELSAYSVFNPDCKSIKGTLKAEQLEAEIRYGGLL